LQRAAFVIEQNQRTANLRISKAEKSRRSHATTINECRCLAIVVQCNEAGNNFTVAGDTDDWRANRWL
jgi:hypothetical protein